MVFYPNLVQQRVRSCILREKVSKCSCFVLIFTYNCGLPINFILNLYVSYLLFRFEFAVDVIPNFLGIMFTLFRHIILLMLDHFTGFLSHYISDPFILHQDIWIMCFHEPSPQPCLSFNHVSHIFVKRSFPTIFFPSLEILNLGYLLVYFFCKKLFKTIPHFLYIIATCCE